MTKLINILAAVGSIAMAAIPLSAIGSVAHAAEVRGAHVQVADLDLTNPADVARFHVRVTQAADHICSDAGKSLTAKAACRSAIRQEAVEKLGETQRQNLEYAQAKTMQVAGF